MQRSLLCLSLAALAAPAMAQFTMTVPAGFASTVGNSNNAFPWSRGTASMRFQQVYDTSNFTTQGVTYPVIISGMRYRPYPGAVTSWTGGTWPNIRIDLASCPTDFTGVSSTFASNLGPDLATVLTGPVTVNGGSTLGAGVVVPWHIDIPFTTPFVYDPSLGNDLTLDVYLDGTGWTGTSRGLDVVSGTTAPNVALGSRIYATAGLAATTGTVGLNHSLICEFTYVPAAGLYAGFSANVTSGPVPLSVNFTDTTFTSDPAGVTSWQWDLDGDNVVDSTLQNPTFVYNTCGAYNVRLTVTDNSHAPSTLTRTGYIQVGISPITPSFTYASIAPGVFQFTDTSTPVPASWAWDLDGDGITDSTAQNPVWAYTSPCTSVNVRLSVSSSCAGPWSTTQPIVLSPLTATAVPFTGGNGTTSTTYVGNMFDLTVTNPNGITVCALTQGIYTYSGPFTADVYITDGSYLGKEANAAAWRLVASGSGTAAGGPVTPSTPYPVALNNSFYLPAGNYGMVVFLSRVGGSMNVSYTNGPQGPIVTPDVTFFPNPTTAPGRVSTTLFTGAGIVSRCWNGSLHYSTLGNGNMAGYGFYGPGCAGSLGISRLAHSAPPTLGSTLSVTVNNLPFNAAFMLTGFSRTTSLFGPLPFDVSVYGAPGCWGRASTEACILLLGTGNTAVWNFAIPNDPSYVGMQMYNQAIALDTGWNALGAVMSDAAAMMIGL